MTISLLLHCYSLCYYIPTHLYLVDMFCLIYDLCVDVEKWDCLLDTTETYNLKRCGSGAKVGSVAQSSQNKSIDSFRKRNLCSITQRVSGQWQKEIGSYYYKKVPRLSVKRGLFASVSSYPIMILKRHYWHYGTLPFYHTTERGLRSPSSSN